MSEENDRVGEKDLKVTDKRMFTADGELREEYRHLDRGGESASEAAPEPPAAEPPASEAAPEAPAPEPPAAEAAPEPRMPEPRMPEPRRAEPAPGATAQASGPAPGEVAAEPPPAAEGDDAPRLEIPGTPEGLGAPTFLDLVTLLAEPIALYLGDVDLPDGKSAENLDMARLHIDLLDVLRLKTAGNLEVGESRLLEDLLYRCRLRYVQKRG